METMKKRWIRVWLLEISLLAACTMPQENLPPQGDPGALYTEAAQTVSVKMSAEGVSSEPAGSIAGTALPEDGSPLQPSETFTIPTITPTGTANGTPIPCDRVRFIKDVTIPDEMDLSPGEAFTKTWRLQNVGSCPWTIGYLLYFESGNIMGGPTSQYLTSEPVFSGEMIDVSVDLVAPEEIGAYEGNWKLRNVKGEGFGIGEYNKAFWVKINVVEGAGTMFDFNAQADQAAWGFGSTPVDYLDLGEGVLDFDQPSDPGEPYVALLEDQFLEGGEISGVVLAAYPAQGEGEYVIGRFPSYQVNSGDLLFGRVGLATNFSGVCETGDVTFRITIQIAGDPATKSILWEWNEVCDSQMKSFEIDLDSYQGELVELFLVVIGNTDSADNLAIWDSLSIHR
jgi:hypothetical protein